MRFSPKIQRLVTPVRLQRRRHLRALKVRRIEHQRDQKTEYEYVRFLYTFLLRLTKLQCAPRQAHRREKGEGRCHQGVAQEVCLSPSLSATSGLNIYSLIPGPLKCIFLGLLVFLRRGSYIRAVDAHLPSCLRLPIPLPLPPYDFPTICCMSSVFFTCLLFLCMMYGKHIELALRGLVCVKDWSACLEVQHIELPKSSISTYTEENYPR